MNPLLLSLGLKKPGDPAMISGLNGAVDDQADPETAAPNMFSFAGLISDAPLAPSSDNSDILLSEAGIDDQPSPLSALMDQITRVLDQLTELAHAPDVPAELSQKIQGAIEKLAGAIEQLQTVAVKRDGAIPKAFLAELSNGANSELPPQANGVQTLHQGLQELEQTLSAAMPNLKTSQPALQLGAIMQVLGDVQKLARPVAAMHPVVVTPDLEQKTVFVNQTSQSVMQRANTPQPGFVTSAALTTDAGPFDAEAGEKTDFTVPLTRFGANKATSTPSIQVGTPPAQLNPMNPGAIDLPREMIQIVPQEAVSLVQSTPELSIDAKSVEAAQQARPDTPQAKFTQAVVGQLRSFEFKEGTTKVALNPRGLGQVEVEMKTNSDGTLSVVVRAESAHVLSSLRSETDLLAQIVGQSGEGTLDFQEFGSDQGQEFSENAASAGGFEDEAGNGTSLELSDTEDTQTIGNGQLDLTT
ncbi:MAG: flagellar hook-length control protein FliK [Cognatishimia sp.]